MSSQERETLLHAIRKNTGDQLRQLRSVKVREYVMSAGEMKRLLRLEKKDFKVREYMMSAGEMKRQVMSTGS